MWMHRIRTDGRRYIVQLVAIIWKWWNFWSNRVHAYLRQHCPITKHRPRNVKKMRRVSMDVPSICTVSAHKRQNQSPHHLYQMNIFRHSRETWHTEQWRSVRGIRLRFTATGRIKLWCERSIDNTTKRWWFGEGMVVGQMFTGSRRICSAESIRSMWNCEIR